MVKYELAAWATPVESVGTYREVRALHPVVGGEGGAIWRGAGGGRALSWPHLGGSLQMCPNGSPMRSRWC